MHVSRNFGSSSGWNPWGSSSCTDLLRCVVVVPRGVRPACDSKRRRAVCPGESDGFWVVPGGRVGSPERGGALLRHLVSQALLVN